MADTKIASKPTNDILTQVVEKVRAGDNVLVALSNNPSVDEMAAAIGLTLALDKIGKHATAIFSGQIPNALEFLQPEDTFEPNTDSLRDFIIALNKEKADHLRYKIEGDYVKVFITPYRTTINEGDLEFSHGDFNVDLVLALNVATPAGLDGALAEHGRIMHSAGSVNITAGVPGKFGDLEWNSTVASSVSEMVGMLVERLDEGKNGLLDKQVATAILTGIVAATNRFSNEKTSPSTMVMASRLMEMGADQKLISSNIPVDMAENVAEAVAAQPSQDATVLSVDRGGAQSPSAEVVPPQPTEPGMQGAVDFAPSEVAMQGASPERELEKILQPSVVTESAGGPLMDELRQAAEDEVQAGDLRDNVPKKDYSALIEQELKTPIGEEATVAPVDNLATQATPAVDSNPEINGVPVINYALGAVDTPAVVAPTGAEQAYAGVATAPQAVAVSADTVAQTAVPAVSPLPMPNGVLPPPPPPLFDPNTASTAAVVAPIASPVASPSTQQEQSDGVLPVAVAQPVMPAVVPIQPAAPVSEEQGYLGSNPAMQDQVYPSQEVNNDPGAFRLPS
jgi:hypothetical protein